MNFKDKHILLLTGTNLTCNPRCLKEVNLFVELGATVTVVAFNLHNWSDSFEKIIIKEKPTVQFHYLESTRKNFIPWLIGSFMEKSARIIIKFFLNSTFLAAMATSKRSWYLLHWWKENKLKPDLIIAHNPAAFYPAYCLGRKYEIPFAVDVEDYHPGESIDSSVKIAVTALMAKLLPLAAYVSYASPLIMEFSKKNLFIKSKSDVVINNFFIKKDFENPSSVTHEKMMFVWFSQNIDYGRGLEELLSVFTSYRESIELTLIGNVKKKFHEQYLKNKNGIKILPPMQSSELHRIMKNYDVGLAIEPGKDVNNNIALSNKILTYFQAGLYILASDTEAQKMFLKEHPNHGFTCSLSRDDIIKTFEIILKNKEKIRKDSSERFKKASLHNWENESRILTAKWNSVLH